MSKTVDLNPLTIMFSQEVLAVPGSHLEGLSEAARLTSRLPGSETT